MAQVMRLEKLACLEGKDLVNELADRTGLLEAKALCCLLETANHGRRTAQKNLDIIGRLGKIFLEHGQAENSKVERARTYVDHVGSDVANATSPTLLGLVEDVVNADTRVLLSESVEVLLEKDILGSNVGKDEVDLGLVSGSSATNDGADDLEHGSDSSTASNHTKVSNHIGSVDKGALGATDLDGLTHGERGHVLGDVALRIRLD